MQDNTGNTQDTVVDGSEVGGSIVDAIAAAGGPQYSFTEVDPVDDQDGGIPGGNIRVSFLYRPERVELAPSAQGRAGEPAEAVSVVGQGVSTQLSVNPGTFQAFSFDSLRTRLLAPCLLPGCHACARLDQLKAVCACAWQVTLSHRCRSSGTHVSSLQDIAQTPRRALQAQGHRRIVLCLQRALWLQRWLRPSVWPQAAASERWRSKAHAAGNCCAQLCRGSALR